MARVLESLPRASRVAILRLRSLGDCVLTTPSIRLLKGYRPDLRVAIAVEDRFREVFEGNSDVDEILPAAIGAVRGFRPELCINFHGGTRSAWMTALSGARWRAGFGHFRNGFVYNLRVPRAQEVLRVERKVHTAEHLASAMFWLGVPESEIPRARLTGRPMACPTNTAVVHAFAARADKTWDPVRFIEVAQYLKSSGYEPVFIGGTGDDLTPFRAYRTIAGAPLSEIKDLLAGASLFVGNDSGPAHMAAAFGLPVVVIFSASDPEIWGPWRTPGEIVRAPASVPQVIEALQRVRVHA